MFYDYNCSCDTLLCVCYEGRKEAEEEGETQEENELQDYDALKRERIGIFGRKIYGVIFRH